MRTMIPVFGWLWLLATTVAPNVKSQTVVRDESRPRCTARELSRARLIVEGGRELYLEPVVFAVSGERALLAGKPSYIFRNRAPGDTADLESRHVIFGALIEPDGTARTVSPPPVNDGKVTAVAAAASGVNSWRVIFAELDSIATNYPQVISAYWHGMYDGTRWSALERLPQPEGVSLLYSDNSQVKESGDTVVWAALARVANGRHGVALFERRGGAWSHLVPTTPFASGVEVVHVPTLGFVLAVFKNELRPAHSFRTLFFYPRRSNWQLHRKIELGEDPTIVGGKLHFSAETGMVTWMGRAEDAVGSRLELRAMVGALLDHDAPVIIVDRDAIPQFAPVAMSGGEVAWLTYHSTVPGDSTGTGDLQLVRLSDGIPEVLWRTPQPYLGPFTATAYSASDVLIAGPVLDRDHELLVSLIIRLRIDCEGGGRPGN